MLYSYLRLTNKNSKNKTMKEPKPVVSVEESHAVLAPFSLQYEALKIEPTKTTTKHK